MKNNSLKLTKLEKIEMNSINGGTEGGGGSTGCSCSSCSCGTGDTIPTQTRFTSESSLVSASKNFSKVVDPPSLP